MKLQADPPPDGLHEDSGSSHGQAIIETVRQGRVSATPTALPRPPAAGGWAARLPWWQLLSPAGQVLAGYGPGQPRVGDIRGDYQLVGLLGHGSTSFVFRGRHRKLKIPAAIKFLRRSALADAPYLLGQLVSEALLLARVNHPNVVRLWDLDDDGAYPYLAMEYVEGTTLRDLIRTRGPVPYALAFAYVRQAVEGLAEAHRHGIVHRDVKPGNLLVRPDGVVKVSDLGLGVSVAERIGRAATGRPGELPAGTAAYLAPEQARDPYNVDFRADVYSLGATLYHAVTGRLPFEGRSQLEVIRKHLVEAPVPARQHVPELPAAACDLILRMLAKDPADRFSTYDDLRLTLAQAVGDRRAPRPLAESFLVFAERSEAVLKPEA